VRCPRRAAPGDGGLDRACAGRNEIVTPAPRIVMGPSCGARESERMDAVAIVLAVVIFVALLAMIEGIERV